MNIDRFGIGRKDTGGNRKHDNGRPPDVVLYLRFGLILNQPTTDIIYMIIIKIQSPDSISICTIFLIQFYSQFLNKCERVKKNSVVFFVPH